MESNGFHAAHSMADKAVEVVSWDPADHVDLPGFAHGLTRYGGHWMDVGISVIPVAWSTSPSRQSSKRVRPLPVAVGEVVVPA